MMLAILQCCVGDSRVFCAGVNEKKDFVFTCQPHLLITMMVEGKIDCTSVDGKYIVFEVLQKRYCRGCVRHYSQNLCNIYKSKIFSS